MMVDRVRKLMAAGVLAGCAQAFAAPPPPGPVCGDAGVLRQVDEIMRARGRPIVLEVPPVGELSTNAGAVFPPTTPALAHCAVRGHTVGYDTTRYGASPVNEPFIVRYSVESRQNGLFVQVD